jgi:hypothetical protein
VGLLNEDQTKASFKMNPFAAKMGINKTQPAIVVCRKTGYATADNILYPDSEGHYPQSVHITLQPLNPNSQS